MEFTRISEKPENDSTRVEETLLEKKQQQLKDLEAPEDKKSIVFFIYLLFGIACLLPWNIFINKEDYFKDKLNTNTSSNASYRSDFTFIVGTVGQMTNVVMNLVNILIVCGGDPKNRIPWTIALSSMVMLFHVVMAAINTYTWPFAFFLITCISVFVMYVATGIMQSCIYYTASLLPAEYTNAVILGNNLAGIFTSVMNIMSDLATPNLQFAAIIYFTAAFAALAAAFVGYFMLNKLEFFVYHANKARMNRSVAMESGNTRPPYMKIIKKIWPLLLSIWLNFFSTLAIFPVFQLGVEPLNASFWDPSGKKSWFHAIVTFLTFNVFVLIGNLIPRFVQPKGPKYLPLAVVIRAVLAFLFFAFSNFEPAKRTLPVLIGNDFLYWAGCILFPIVFGYLTSLLMMFTPKQVEPEYAGTAGMLSSLALVIGVTSGINFTILYRMLVLINYGGSTKSAVDLMSMLNVTTPAVPTL